jgi:hypothetical protein
MANGWGGYRPGGGRPRGAKNRKPSVAKPRQRRSLRGQRVINQEAALQGLSPLEYMLNVLRDENAEQFRRDEFAWRAAPFCHPRLVSMHAQHDVRGEIANSIYVEQINIVAVPSGKFLTPEEATMPIIEEVKEPAFLALESPESTPGDTQLSPASNEPNEPNKSYD